MKFKVAFYLVCLLAQVAHAQTSVTFDFADAELTDGKNLKLEAFEYRPAKWNGKVILMSHGSTGGKPEAIKNSIKFLNISKEATANGYIFVAFMRKGRGQSEGRFTEETGRCDSTSLKNEKSEAERQLRQVVAQAKKKYGVSKFILMGHSRGGYLSATYAAQHPNDVLAVVNLAGAWSAICENKNGGLGRQGFENAAKNFKPQFWAYFEQDTYFAANRFNDANYIWFAKTAESNGVNFLRFGHEGMPDGHSTPTFKPGAWARAIFPRLNEI